MTNAEKAQALYNLVGRVTAQARQDQRRALADSAGTSRSAEIWRQNPENALDRCPYNVQAAEERLARADAEVQKWEGVLEFTVQTFLKEMP